MDNIIPTKPVIPRPPPPPRIPLAGRHDPAFAFSLAGLMRSMESAGYPEAVPPAGLKVKYLP